MTENNRCSHCGSERSANATGGLCLRCLAQLGVAGLASGPGLDGNDTPEYLQSSAFDDYELLEEIGHGGMGIVHKARQLSLNRLVALKVIKPGMDSGQVLARFEAERQALALMDHLNIARVFDAGTTSSGRPYFVMELALGTPITRFCDEQRLTIRERLELFMSVCQAIQHAHQKGIIHRDIKPSNVLVTLQDGKPVPKVIDFGVAKAIGSLLTKDTLATEVGAVVGTLEYMSPEQAKLDQLDIDTRSDIYALGILLYELLTGTTPLNRKTLKTAAFDEVLRLIREREPPRPSTRLTETSETLATISAQRKLAMPQLTKLVRGDLDWIVMKALEKERTRRYETANVFAMDIQRYLHDEPVVAGPPTARYRLKKFVKKHRVGVVASTVFLMGLATATAVSAALAVRANRERVRADEAQVQAVGNLYTALDAVKKYLTLVAEQPELKRPEMLSYRKELLRAAVPFLDDFARQQGGGPTLMLRRAAAYRTIAEVQAQLGPWSEAITNLLKARKIYEDCASSSFSAAQSRQEWAESCGLLGKLMRFSGQGREAEAFHREAIAIGERLVVDFPGEPMHRCKLAASQADFATFLFDTGRLREGKAQYKRAADDLFLTVTAHPNLRECAREFIRTVVRSESYVAWYEAAAPERTSALAQARSFSESLAKTGAPSPEDRLMLARALLLLGEGQQRRGSLENAERSLRESIELWNDLVGQFPYQSHYHVGQAGACERLAMVLAALGRSVDAEQAFEKSAKILQARVDLAFVDDDTIEQLARTYGSLAHYHRQAGHAREAREDFEQSRQHQENLLTRSPARPRFRAPLAKTQYDLGQLLAQSGQISAASTAFSEALVHYLQLIDDAPGEPFWQQRADETRARIKSLPAQPTSSANSK